MIMFRNVVSERPAAARVQKQDRRLTNKESREVNRRLEQ
jgi:hypothetical protein